MTPQSKEEAKTYKKPTSAEEKQREKISAEKRYRAYQYISNHLRSSVEQLEKEINNNEDLADSLRFVDDQRIRMLIYRLKQESKTILRRGTPPERLLIVQRILTGLETIFYSIYTGFSAGVGVVVGATVLTAGVVYKTAETVVEVSVYSAATGAKFCWEKCKSACATIKNFVSNLFSSDEEASKAATL